MRIFKQTIKSVSTTSFIPLASTTTGLTVAAVVFKAVVRSFGVTSVTPTAVQQIVKNVVLDFRAPNIDFFLAETVATTGVLLTVALFGMPVFLATSIVNIPVIVPATASLILMLACDVTLILSRAFQKCTGQCLGHPSRKDIEEAAFAYRGLSREVHKSISHLIPKFSVAKSFQFDKIKIGYSSILQKYIEIFVEARRKPETFHDDPTKEPS